MAYDQESERAIIFGGLTGTWEDEANYKDETWAYDPIANQWALMNPAGGPTRREGAELVYDIESDRVILFGGNSPDVLGLRDTWAYDTNTNTWTYMAQGPSRRYNSRMAYDAESDRVILFGGQLVGTGGQNSDETWVYDFNSDTWTKMEPSVSPPGWHGFGMTYNSTADRILVWGVGAGHVWAYDYNTNTWEDRQPGEGDWPRTRDACAMTYDALSDKTVLYGGARFGDETWAYDYNTNSWKKLELDPVPGKLWSQAMAYSPAIDRIILFGGEINQNKEIETGDTWLFDLNTSTWTNVGLKP